MPSPPSPPAPDGTPAVAPRTRSASARVLMGSADLRDDHRRLSELTEELRRVRDFLDRTGALAGVGGFEVEVLGHRVIWSEAARRIHEVDSSFVPTMEGLLDFYPGEARGLVTEALEQALVAGRGFDLELPFVTARGRNLWVRAVGSAEHEDAEVVRVVVAIQDITERRMLEHDLRRRARFDNLTGLLNRGTFEAALAEAFTRQAEGTWLLGVDLDGFKLINDGCGHALGDRVLRDVALVMQQAASEQDAVARVGGDEFALLLMRRDKGEAVAVGERIMQGLSLLDFTVAGRHYRVQASMGLVPVDGGFDGPDQLSAAADECCRAAKASGKNRVRVWRPDDEAVAAVEPHWAQRLEWALTHQGVVLHAQRLVSLERDEGALRCEVLPRLVEVPGRLIMPHAFVDAAERFRFAARIDLAVLDGVLTALRDGPFPPAGSLLSVNLSAQLLAERASQAALHDRLAAAPWAAGFIAFELDEATALESPVAAVSLARDLRALGARVTLDNFGGGATSIHRLRDLQPDLLKLDPRLVQNLPSDPMTRALTRGLLEVARVMDVQLVAKGIESSAILEAAIDAGLELGQGFYLHEPEPLERLLAVCAVRTPAA